MKLVVEKPEELIHFLEFPVKIVIGFQRDMSHVSL